PGPVNARPANPHLPNPSGKADPASVDAPHRGAPATSPPTAHCPLTTEKKKPGRQWLPGLLSVLRKRRVSGRALDLDAALGQLGDVLCRRDALVRGADAGALRLAHDLELPGDGERE